MIVLFGGVHGSIVSLWIFFKENCVEKLSCIHFLYASFLILGWGWLVFFIQAVPAWHRCSLFLPYGFLKTLLFNIYKRNSNTLINNYMWTSPLRKSFDNMFGNIRFCCQQYSLPLVRIKRKGKKNKEDKTAYTCI